MIRVLMPTDGTDLHVLIFPAEDLPGIWVAHVLEADLVTQGDSIGESLDMAADAWAITPPEARDRPAPAEDWDRWRDGVDLESIRERLRIMLTRVENGPLFKDYFGQSEDYSRGRAGEAASQATWRAEWVVPELRELLAMLGEPSDSLNVCDACGETDVSCVRKGRCEKSR